MEDDWESGLDLGVAPLDPAHLTNPLFIWDTPEEDLQCAALGWMLFWRRQGNTLFVDGKKCYYARPVEEVQVFKAMHDRILDWHWVEKGGGILDEIHQVLIERTHIRLKETEPCKK